MSIRARAATVLLTLAVVWSGASCSDSTAPDDLGVGVSFAVVPAAVSAAENAAIQAVIGDVTSYLVTIADSLTGLTVAVDSLTVDAGQTRHTLDVGLPLSTVGRTLSAGIIAYDGALELYRGTGYFVARERNGTPPAIALAIRYTGPGVRGVVADSTGTGLGAVGVELYRGATLVDSALTEPDGTYLFANLVADTFRVQPVPSSGFVCPVDRTLDVQVGESLVADFVVQSTTCSVDLLIISGGDVNDLPAVQSMLSGFVASADTFFYVNQSPGLATLRQYDVVLLYMNGLFDEAVELGDEIADYVDAGGNVVFGSFYWQGRSDSGLGSPGWGALEGLDPFTSTGGATYVANSLSTVGYVPAAHPVTDSVFSITSAAGYGAGVAAKAQTTVLASWTDGAPLVGIRVLPAGQRLVAVSLFPAAVVPTDASGSVQQLWKNAVTWAGQAGGPAP